MADAVSGVRGQLWPVPEQMKQYLDNWVTYTRELEQHIKLLQEGAEKRESVLTERITALRNELTATEAPLVEKVGALEAERVNLRAENAGLRNELDSAVRLLAAALEVTNTQRLSLLSLINDAVILVEESKKQFRRSL